MRLDVDLLKQRLQKSPWRQGDASRSESWLKEAALASNVSLVVPRAQSVKSGVRRTKEAVVEDVVEAAHRLRTAAAQDDGFRVY